MRRGQLICDFNLAEGSGAKDALPAAVAARVEKVGITWVIGLHKRAERVDGSHWAGIGVGRSFAYPIDAVAVCARRKGHQPPDPTCTCGFHALLDHAQGPYQRGSLIEVLLMGRTLVFDSPYGELLIAERQHVVEEVSPDTTNVPDRRPVDDPKGRMPPRFDPPAGSSVRSEPVGSPPLPPSVVRRLVLPAVELPHCAVDDATLTVVHDPGPLVRGPFADQRSAVEPV